MTRIIKSEIKEFKNEFIHNYYSKVLVKITDNSHVYIMNIRENTAEDDENRVVIGWRYMNDCERAHGQVYGLNIRSTIKAFIDTIENNIDEDGIKYYVFGNYTNLFFTIQGNNWK